MRVLVCGSRAWTDVDLVTHRLREILNETKIKNSDFTIIDGLAHGADHAGFISAGRLGMASVRFPANWNKYGLAAGPIRNQQMLDEGKPDLVFAFHDDIEHSKGTGDMVRRARKAGIPVEVISHG